jgi:hypothetical protein
MLYETSFLHTLILGTGCASAPLTEVRETEELLEKKLPTKDERSSRLKLGAHYSQP